MPRFDSSRASTGDSSDFQYNLTSGRSEGTSDIAGFAASAAAGGVASTMQTETSSGRRQGKQKSITSGISTLFRRQPTADVDEGQFAYNGRDPSGAYAGTRVVSSTSLGDSSAWTDTTGSTSGRGSRMMGLPKKIKGSFSNPISGRGRKSNSGSQSSRSRSGKNPFKQQQQQQLQSQNQILREQQREAQTQQHTQQYSQTQRDLLHGGAYDTPQYVQQHLQPTQNQRASKRDGDLSPRSPGSSPGLSPSMSRDASDMMSGATSLSQEYSDRDRRHRRSYDDETMDTYENTEGGDESTYEGDESTRDESTVEDQRRGQRVRDLQTGSSGGDKGWRRSPTSQMRLPRRYRGFSTSISSLFLDESIVCGAVSCCGLLLSARTEHLLNERNIKRGITRRGVGGAVGRGKEGARRSPSRILGIAWVVTILGVLATYVIWGFEDQQGAGDLEDWYEWDSDRGSNQNDDDQNQADDDGGQNQANDDANQAGDDAAQGDDGAQNDDLAANDDVAAEEDEAGDDALQADDGLNNGDDAIQADDGANDDAAAADDLNDDWNRKRKLKNGQKALPAEHSFEPKSIGLASEISPKHSFNGIMKLREQREYVFDPAVEFTSQMYTNLMSQLKEDEYSFGQRLLDEDEYEYQYNDQYEDSEVESLPFEQGQQIRTILIVLFLFLLGVIGRRRRMRTRFAILRSRAQDDHLYYASILTKNDTGTSGSLATPDNTVMENFHEREDKYDGACSHTLFGCYPVDSQPPYYADYGGEESGDEEAMQEGTFLSRCTSGTAKRKRKGGDFMARTMTALLSCCCGGMCQCWCQLFSVCALAQEAREARLLLPPSMQRIDIITHQPFHEYAKDVTNVRRRFMQKANRTWLHHWAALSHLSRYIILGFVLITAFVVTVMFVHPMGGFDWGDAIVLIATFTQSFLVLLFVFGIFHRSDLSFDAVVKFFAVGFAICVPVGFVVEAMVMNSLFMIYYVMFYMLHWIGGVNFDDWYEEYYSYIHIAGELINAYFIAALVEELCKYYGFRFVEHPDLIFLTGLDRSATQTRDQGGIDSYKYDSQLVSAYSRESQVGDNESETDSRGRKRTNKRRQKILLEEDDEDEPDIRSLQQQAAAITTGMISVAVGLACAENFLYVFFLGGAGGDKGSLSVAQEMAILLFRSAFPVHALSAAMQSINMIRKFIEEKHGGARNIGVGRIIFPAILLHGSFDAVLLAVNAYIESAWDRYYENGGLDDDEYFEKPYNALAVNLIAPLGIIGVMAASFGWYSYQNKSQMSRLANFDRAKNKSRSSGRGGFNAPNLV